MPEAPEDFAVHPFVQELFEDLSLTLPSLGCRFEGTVTPNDQTANGKRVFLKNKLFLLFADIAQNCPALRVKFSLTLQGELLNFCFISQAPVSVSKLKAWSPEMFHEVVLPDGTGFATTLQQGKPLQSGPPLEWRELARLYGGQEAGKKVVEAFIERTESLVPALGTAIQGELFSEVLRIAHTLKGSARGVFALPFSNAALKLEMVSRAGNLTGADELYKRLTETYSELVAWIRKGSN